MLSEYEQQQARELDLYIDNDDRFAIWSPKGMGKAIRENLAKKWNSGKFDPFLALKALDRLAILGAKTYSASFPFEGDPPVSGRKWSMRFSKPARAKWAARELGQLICDWLEKGEAY